MKRLLLLAGLLACAPALADDPPKPAPKPAPAVAFTVDPAGPVAPGTMVTIDATASVGDDVDIDTDVPIALYRVDSNKRKVYFTTIQPGSYLFRIESLSVVDGKFARDRGKPTIVVKSADPPPVVTPPQPVGPVPAPVVTPPTPAPAPTPTTDRFGLTAATTKLLAGTPYTAEQKAYIRSTIAPVYAAHSADWPQAIEATVPAAVYSGWKAALFAPIRVNVDTLIAAGKVSTPVDLAQAFRDISTALGGVQ